MLSKFTAFALILIFLFEIISISPTAYFLTNSNSSNENLSLFPKTINNPQDINKVNSLPGNFTPIVQDGSGRDGSTFAKAIDLKENTFYNNSFQNTNSAFYYRYYALYPYEYINITLLANTTSDNIYLYDQFNYTAITSNTAIAYNKSIIIASSQSSLQDRVRFIGWYYIKVTGISSSFQIIFTFTKGDGSSLWDPIQISNQTLSWQGKFQAMENSHSYRFSTFYAFYINSSLPEFTVSINSTFQIWLYGPDFSFLDYFSYGGVKWIPTVSGFYYIEIGNGNLINHYISISINLQTKTQTVGDSMDQPLEIKRSTGLTDTMPMINPIRYLKLFLYIGENVSVNIGNEAGMNYSVIVYGAWGLEWFTSTTNLYKSAINLNNVENSGYYIFAVSGPPGSYSVKVHFNYIIQEGISWESSKIVNLNNQFSDNHYLYTNDSYYYRINFLGTPSLNISITGMNIKDAYILGKDREILSHLTGENDFVILNSINNTNFIYVQIIPKASPSNYLLQIKKVPNDFSYTLKVDGRLFTFNKNTNKNETVDLVSISLVILNTTGIQTVLESSTDEYGFFSFIYTRDIQVTSFYLKIQLIGPAINLLSYVQGHGQSDGTNFIITINLDKTLIPLLHLGDILLPGDREMAHIFTTITHGWLWIKNLDKTHIGPQQITMLYSADSPGTYYIPYDSINNIPTKYVIYLHGYLTGDDDGWDDSVFLHEYGHHVEQTYAITNNPGGSHAYSSTISPDFAHGEGFPTFFASQVLNSSIYKDTNNNGYDGINLATGRRLITNRLEDLYGAYGETSVMTLYYALVTSTNGDDVNNDGIGNSVTISEADLFNVFLNFRRSDGLGVTNTDELYQGLIATNPSLIDNISKTFYNHGNSFYEDPFVGNSVTNKIVSLSDTQTNFTWKLYDSNPKSYQILVDSKVVKTGAWNFTEDVIVLNIHQFNLSVGNHEFTLKINDTLDNQRVYNYTVTIVQSIASVGHDIVNSIPIEPNTKFFTFSNLTTYFSYQSDQTELLDLYIVPSGTSDFNLTLYNQNNQILQIYNTIQNAINVYIDYNASFPIYMVFGYKTGNGSVQLDMKDNLIGYSFINPVLVNNIQTITNFGNATYSNYYLRLLTSYYTRNISFTRIGNIQNEILVEYENGSLLTSFTFTQTNNEFNYILPINKNISDIQPYNAFPDFILQFISNKTSITGNLSLTALPSPVLTYSGPVTFSNVSDLLLNLTYSGTSSFNYSILLNNQKYTIGFYNYIAGQNNTLQIPFKSLTQGVWVVDISVKDINGLITFYQFSFSIVPPTVTTHSTVNTEQLPLLLIALFTILAIVVIIGLVFYHYKQEKMKSVVHSIKTLFKKQKNSNG